MFVQRFLHGAEMLESLFGSCCRFHKTKLPSVSFSALRISKEQHAHLQSSLPAKCDVFALSPNRQSFYLSRAQTSIYLCFQPLHHCCEQRLLSFIGSVMHRLLAATNNVVFEPHHDIQRLLRRSFQQIFCWLFFLLQRDIFGGLKLFVYRNEEI